jgi:hypothetical protein
MDAALCAARATGATWCRLSPSPRSPPRTPLDAAIAAALDGIDAMAATGGIDVLVIGSRRLLALRFAPRPWRPEGHHG